MAQSKTCNECNKIKPIREFHKRKKALDGHVNSCKECIKLKTRKYYKKNKKDILTKNKLWRKENKEAICEYEKKRAIENKEKNNKYKKKWYLKNKEKCIERSKKHYLDNKNKKLEYVKEYRVNNKEKINLWFRKRYKTNIQHNLRLRISKSINSSIKDKKNRSWGKIVGYNIFELISHLEKTSKYKINECFTKNLHIDHIIPQSLYCFESYEDEEFRKCWNLRNLRLLPATENFFKKNKLDFNLVKKYKIEDLLPQGVSRGTIAL